MWLMTTPAWRTGRGRWWKYQLSGFGIGWVSKNKSRHVRSRQQASPRHLIRPAPNINRNSVQRYIQFSAAIGATVRAPGEDREESHLDQQRLPAEGVEGLADVDERKIQHVEQGPHGASGDRTGAGGQTRQSERGQQHAQPSSEAERRVSGRPVEETWRKAERHLADEERRRQQPMLSGERNELFRRGEEGDEIDEGQAAFEQPARTPVLRQVFHPSHQPFIDVTRSGDGPLLLSCQERNRHSVCTPAARA